MNETELAAPAESATEQPRPVSEIFSYHAHIYYRPQVTRALAEQVRVDIGERFSVRLGRWHDVLVGPHTAAMFLVAFSCKLFSTFVPWLMLNRRGLAVLIHPNTDSPKSDHLEHALWLGEILPVMLERLPASLAALGEHVPTEDPNTNPTKSP